MEHIQRVAPSVYYTQDRMVNGRDYNTFMLQDPSILRMRAVNRTFAGDSKFIAWHDPRENYEDVRLFGDDLALYWDELSPVEGGLVSVNTDLDPNQLRIQHIEPLLSSMDFFSIIAPILEDLPDNSPSSFRRTFLPDEIANIELALETTRDGTTPSTDIYYLLDSSNAPDGEWIVNPNIQNASMFNPASIFMLRIETLFTAGIPVGWEIKHRVRQLVAQSSAIRFFNTNTTDTVINFDTLNPTQDNIVVLQANTNADNTAMLSSNTSLSVTAQRLFDVNNPYAGLPNPNELAVASMDTNQDGIPDNIQQAEIMGDLTNPSFAYLTRESTSSPWTPVPESQMIIDLVEADSTRAEAERLHRRVEGRFPLNFAWMHSTPNLGLIDPAASNIIDMYIVTTGYYSELVRYLSNRIDDAPLEPTPHELRNTYADLLGNKMISDTVILHPGMFKILFGPRAPASLQARFKVVRPDMSTLTDAELKVNIVGIIRNFFDLSFWEFGETFFFTELSAAIHAELGPELDSIVLVPLAASTQFGDLFQIQATENELFIPDINVTDIEIVNTLTPQNIRQ